MFVAEVESGILSENLIQWNGISKTDGGYGLLAEYILFIALS